MNTLELNKLVENLNTEELSFIQELAGFWFYVSKTTDCWIWIGNITENGYGRCRFQNKLWLAHRLSYIIHFGEILDPSLMVCHKCDNPPCINPEHLFLGYHADNMKDMAIKQRKAVKLTESQIIDIRFKYNQDSSLEQIKKLAINFNVSTTSIRAIVNRKTWKYV